MDDAMKKAYDAMINQRERAKRNYEANKERILEKRKAKRDERLANTERRPRGRPRKEAEVV